MADLLIDVGNTFLKAGIWEGNGLKHSFRMSTVQFLRRAEHLLMGLKNFSWRRVAISSVVKDANEDLKILFPKALFVSTSIKLPIEIDYKTPETLGADRIANACGGLDFGNTFAVVSVGTAVVVDLVNDKVFQGGVIFPGLRTMANALSLNTSQLPQVKLPKEIIVPGKSTAECIESGIPLAVIGGIKEALRNYGVNTVLLTGGDSKFLKQFLPKTFHIPDLTFIGLNTLLNLNQ